MTDNIYIALYNNTPTKMNISLNSQVLTINQGRDTMCKPFFKLLNLFIVSVIEIYHYIPKSSFGILNNPAILTHHIAIRPEGKEILTLFDRSKSCSWYSYSCGPFKNRDSRPHGSLNLVNLWGGVIL